MSGASLAGFPMTSSTASMAHAQQVITEVVSPPKTLSGTYGLSYDTLTAVAIKAMQEL